MTGMSQPRTDTPTLARPGGATPLCRVVCGLVWLVGLWACTPALNWRDVRFDNARLIGWLPCKPDTAERSVTLEGRSTPLRLMGCEADGMDFTLAQLQLPERFSAQQAQQAWQAASLSSLQAAAVLSSQDWTLGGSSSALVPQRVVAQGGQGVTARWAWFAYDGQLYQAAVYARASRAARADQAMDTLVSGLRLP